MNFGRCPLKWRSGCWLNWLRQSRTLKRWLKDSRSGRRVATSLSTVLPLSPYPGPIVREQGRYGTGAGCRGVVVEGRACRPLRPRHPARHRQSGRCRGGTKELADAIAEARTKKRCAAYANGLCASAAYWLASATGTVYAPLTATVGSIGVIMTITNYAKLEEKWGISTVTITGGKWKAAGQGGELTDEERRYFQERINSLHQIFKADVGRHMGLTADPQLWGEAQLLLAQPRGNLALSPILSGIATPRSANSLWRHR